MHTLILVVVAVLLSIPGARADARAVDPEPTLPAAQLVGDGVALSGEDWHVDTPVPVEGFLGQFVVHSRWGPIEAQGRELLALRIAELPALERLDAISQTDVFAEAIGDSARSTGRAVARVVTNPVETAKGVPAGIGRLIGRTASTARSVAVTVGDSARRTLEGEGEGDDEDNGKGPNRIDAKNFANELAGVNRARRDLAREIGIDPYSRNPLIQERLEKLAWAAVAGGVSMNVMLGRIGGPAADMISASRRLDGLVWDLPPDDIRRQLEAKLVERGVEPRAAREFLRNPVFTPTLQVGFVDALEALGQPSGEPDVVMLATGIGSEVHARFLIQQLRMLARHVPANDPISGLVAYEASIAGRSQDSLWIMLPLDFVSWSQSAGLVAAAGGDLPPNLVVAGGISETARREFEQAGWNVAAGVGLEFAQ